MIRRGMIWMMAAILLAAGFAAAEGKAQKAEYEQQARIALNEIMGMPLDAVKDYEEDLYRASEYDPYETDRMVYTAGFHETDGEKREWTVRTDPATGKLISALVTLDSRPYTDDDHYAVSDVRQDPWDPHWEEMAAETVSALRADGGKGIVQVRSQGTMQYNILQCVIVNVMTEDGWVYRVYIPYVFDCVAEVSCNDPIYTAAREALTYESMKREKEGE